MRLLRMAMQRKHFKAIVAALAALFLAAGAGAQNWPSFRGANANGVGRGATPVSWDVAKSTNVAWKTPVPGGALSSPIVWGDRIYVTTAVPLEPARGEECRTRHVWRLMSMDRASGKVVWETTVHEATPFMQRHPKSSYANATPATDGRYIVAVFGTEAFACFDKSGKQLWKKVLPTPGKSDGFHFGTSPVIVGDLTILQDDRDSGSYVAAYRLADGQEVWKLTRNEGAAQSTPGIAQLPGTGRKLVILAGSKTVRGVDALTGKDVWSIASNVPASASAIVAEDLVFFAGGGKDKPVYAIRVNASGDISLASDQSKHAGVAWRTERGGSYIPSPLVVGGQVYVLADNGVLSAYNVQDGQLLFQERAGSGEYYASPIAADGKVYIFNTEGESTVVRAAPKFEVLARNSMNEVTMATPAIVDGTMYVRTAGHLVALRAR